MIAFQVQSVDIRVEKLPLRFDGFSIALLTDVHIGPTVSKKRVEEIVTIVNRLNVDSVSIVGDLVDGFLEHIRSKAMPLQQLKSKHGVFYVTGNHELYHGSIYPLISFLKDEIGLNVLHNDHRLGKSNEDSLIVLPL